ncbi:hypothetical protein SLEP1_g53461 [Rubroshorea leprosula]|uniref:Uncharacterized protein n=1 Tax=Rubroshorea leprosula TaxID=152421 RepID=A0AAV5M9F5_9ROSI|nr:hypothetical protein SLEP1_g53461 [Rubroshorea leprosula]
MEIVMVFMRISLFSGIEHDWNENENFIVFLKLSMPIWKLTELF